MTHQEFEKITGACLSAVEYRNIEDAYMESNLDKEEWCKHYMEIRENPLYKETVKLMLERKDEQLRAEMKTERLAMLLVKRAKGCEASMAEISTMAVTDIILENVGLVMSDEWVLKAKIKNDMRLTKDEKAALCKLLED